MIGQEKLLKTLHNIKELPHCMLIIGKEGSGRKTLVKEVFKGYTIYMVPEVNVAAIREAVQASYKYSNCVFVLANIDAASVNAKNAVLKVVEECPNNNYYVMTATEETAVLPTILSRSYVVRMLPYTYKDLMMYAMSKGVDANSKLESMTWCQTPGDVDLLGSDMYDSIYEYAVFVVDNIGNVSGSNALKITQKLKLNDKDTEKYDLKLFLSIANDYFMQKGIAAFKQDAGPIDFNMARTMAKCCVYTNKVLAILAKKAVNKSMLIDDWIFTVRKYLMEVETDDD